VFNGSAYISSKTDEWHVEFIGDRYILNHKNKKHIKKRYHTHKKFEKGTNFDFVCGWIYHHDKYTKDKAVKQTQKQKRINDLFETIKK
jgi:hypothetical protein